jgi:II/X family phage/plasmid replication protein
MLIDWLTCRLDEHHLSREAIYELRKIGDIIIRFSSETGEKIYETQAWDSIRSDSHAITIRMGSDTFWMQGSPARVIGDGCAVFGSGASSKLDIQGCVEAMRQFVIENTGVQLPSSGFWRVTRIDVTENYLFKNEQEVFDSLDTLSRTDGGRYKVSNQSGNSIYWSHKSRIRKGKAYAKGQHLCYLMKKKGYQGRKYSIYELELSKNLLRLELTIGPQYLRENIRHWLDLTSEELSIQHEKYFGRMIGDASVSNMNELRNKLIEVCNTKAQADKAFNFYCVVQAQGLRFAENHFGRSTFYVHKRNLKKAGLGDSDISTGEISRLRRRVLDMQAVHSWEDLKVA